MYKQCKKNYEAPTITVVTFKVEKGFAESGGILRALALSMALSETYGSQSLENRQDGGNLGWQ